MNRIPRAISIAIVLIVLTLCATWLMRSCARMPGEAAQAAAEPAVELAKRIVDGISRRLQFRPEVRINRETVLQRDTALLELVTVQREFVHEYEWEHQWLGSTKRLRLRGKFAAKAGFDLNDEFYLELDPDSGQVELFFPEPRLLGVEMTGYEAEEEEGYWNKLGAEEREQAVNALLASARHAALNDAALMSEARRMLQWQVGQAVAEANGMDHPRD